MEDTDLKSAIQESLPEDGTAESSPVPAEETAAPVETPTQKVEQPPFHEHTRWKEMQAEKEYYKQMALQAMEIAKRPAAPVERQVDPYEGMTLEEKAAYEKIGSFARAEARKEIEAARKPLLDELSQTKQIQATMLYDRFRSQHPDVAAGSQEENAIARLYQNSNYALTLDDCYNTVMGPKWQSKIAELEKAQKQNKIQQKISTPPESSQSIPPISGVRTKEKVDFRARMAEEMRRSNFQVS